MTTLDILSSLICPIDGARLEISPTGLVTTNGRSYLRTSYGYDMWPRDSASVKERYVAGLYTALSPLYDTIVPSFIKLFGSKETELRNEIIEKLDPVRDGRILEIGVGSGANLPILCERKYAKEIIGVDTSVGMLRQCAKRISKLSLPAHLFRSSGSLLPFENSTFDAVLCVGGFNSFDDKRAALEEMLRVTRSGGRVVLNDEGLSPEQTKHFSQRLLAKTFFWGFAALERGAFEPPVDFLPTTGVSDVNFEFNSSGFFWTLDFTKK